MNMIKVQKGILAALMAVLISVLAAGCSGNEDVQVNITELASKLVENLEWKEELMEVTSDSVLTNYYSVAMEDVDEWALYRSSSGATAEEVAVFMAVSPKAADRIKTAAETRVDDMKFAFEDYIPAELPKIENAVIYTSGNFVVLVTNDDDNAALELVKGFLG